MSIYFIQTNKLTTWRVPPKALPISLSDAKSLPCCGQARGRSDRAGKGLAYTHLSPKYSRERVLKHLPTFSITELSPRKRLVENDIIISSFGINGYRLRYAGSGARGVIYEVLFLSPSSEVQLQLLP